MRKAVGPDVDILLEIHRRLAPMHAIDLADALAEYKPYWLEEPCQSENVEALAEIRHRPDPDRDRRGDYTRADFVRSSERGPPTSSIRTLRTVAAFSS